MLRRLVRAALVLVSALALAGCTASPGGGSGQPTGEANANGNGASGSAASSFARIPSVVDQVKPSVVTIRTPGGQGSGVVYKSNGVIITNQHVVARGQGPQAEIFDRVAVVFATGKQAPGRVVGADYRTDLAVIKVDRGGLRAAEFQKELPDVGELAIAVGTPLKLNESVTAGIISGLNRRLPPELSQTQRPLVNLIQTDAPISPGSSGGALVNGEGEVVGINELYIPPEAGAVSIGFAIPSATVVDVAQQILRTGDVEHAFLGVLPAKVTPPIAEQLGLEDASGVLVRRVVDGTGAARAGIQPGDVIVGLGDATIRSVQDLYAELRQHDPGDSVPVTVIRGGERTQVNVTLTNRLGGSPG